MGYEDKDLLRNNKGEIIPQHYDATVDALKPVKGKDGAVYSLLVNTDGTPITPASGTDISVLKAEVAALNNELPPGLESERPAASPENKGKIYWSIDTGDISVSTGAEWRSLGVV